MGLLSVCFGRPDRSTGRREICFYPTLYKALISFFPHSIRRHLLPSSLKNPKNHFPTLSTSIQPQILSKICWFFTLRPGSTSVSGIFQIFSWFLQSSSRYNLFLPRSFKISCLSFIFVLDLAFVSPYCVDQALTLIIVFRSSPNSIFFPKMSKRTRTERGNQPNP